MATQLYQGLRPPLKGKWVCWACREQSHHVRRRNIAQSLVLPRRQHTSAASTSHQVNTDGVSLLDRRRGFRSLKTSGPKSSPSLAQFLEAQYRVPRPPPPIAKEDKYGIIEATHTGDFSQICFALEYAADDPQYVRSIPSTTWSSILGAIGNQNWLVPYHHRHYSRSPVQQSRFGYEFKARRKNIMDSIYRCMEIRQETNSTLTFVDYRRLLRLSANLGDPITARKIWKDLEQDKLTPDADCYEYMINAITFDEDARISATRKNLKYNDDIVNLDLHDINRWIPGLSEEVRGLYNEMCLKNITPNESSHCAMMIALARDRNLNSALTLLADRWQLKFSAKLDHEMQIEDAQPGTKQINVSRPSKALLTTIAEILGSYNLISAAIRLIDYISERFRLKVTMSTWHTLLQWTYLHGRAQARKARAQGLHLQPVNDLMQLVEVMLSKPYNIKPTLEMMHMLFKSNTSRRLLGTQDFVNPVLVAEAMLGHRTKLSHHLQKQVFKSAQWHPGTFRDISRLRRLLSLQTLEMNMSRWYLIRWVRTIVSWSLANLQTLPPHERPFVHDWYVHGLPNFILRWQAYLKPRTRLQTVSGMIELNIRPHVSEHGAKTIVKQFNALHRTKHRRLSVGRRSGKVSTEAMKELLAMHH